MTSTPVEFLGGRTLLAVLNQWSFVVQGDREVNNELGETQVGLEVLKVVVEDENCVITRLQSFKLKLATAKNHSTGLFRRKQVL